MPIKRAFKIFIFIWPILVMVYLIGNNIFDKKNVAIKLSNPNEVVWGSDDEQITILVNQTSFDEQSAYEITLFKNGGQILSKDEFIIDKDMFGGGFVKAVQADSDQELELVAWGSHEYDKSYMLDFSGGQVLKTDFTKAPEEIRNLANEWRQIHVMDRFTILSLGILFFGYYVFVSIIVIIIKVVRKRKS
ncbi:MAG: hypothetical protein K9L30_04760 [Desulfobacterales bacterium]|nr:hypothetical protein [Desulfobacterales bacterium]